LIRSSIKILLLCFFCLSCSKELETFGKGPDKKNAPPPATNQGPSTPSKNKDIVYKNPTRQARRLALDLQNRLPTNEETDIFVRDLDSAESLTKFFLKSNDADTALANLHRNFWNLWEPRSLAQIAKSDSGLETALSAIASDLILDDSIKTLRFIIGQDESFEQILTKKYSLMEPSTASFYSQSPGPGPVPDGDVVVYGDIFRPNLGVLASFGWNAALPKTKNSINYRGSAETIKKLTCLNFDDIEAHNIGSAGVSTLDYNMLSAATSSPSCTSCHNQFHSLANSLPFLSASNTFADWLAYDQNAFLPGSYKGKSFTTPDELAALIAGDSRIYSCELENITEEILQRPLNSLSDQELNQALSEKWKDSKNIKNMVSEILASPEYQHQIFGASGSKTNNFSSIRLLGPAQWDGFIKQFAPGYSLRKLILLNPALAKSTTNPEVISPAALVPRQQLNGFEKKFVPKEELSQAVFDLAGKIADAIVTAELSSTALAQDRKVLALLPDFDAYGATSSEVKNQIAETWNQWTAIKTTSTDFRVSKLYDVYTESVETGSSDLEKSRHAWKWVLTSILISPEFVIY
jgi:hypothetical protein